MHVECERASAQGGCGFEFDECNAHFGGHRNSRAARAFFNHQGFGVQVVQIKLKLIGTVAGV